MMRPLLVVFALGLLLVGGCAHVISSEGLQQVDRSVRYYDLRTNPDALAGRTVLVGGIIAGVRSSGDVSLIEVAQLELLRNGVPDETSPSGGRFLGVSSELIDPLIYQPGMLITMVGEVKGAKVQKLDEADYRYPLISIREMRQFRSSEPFPGTGNPYQNQFGDSKFLGRPAGLSGGIQNQLY